jgi:hypothetical protein
VALGLYWVRCSWLWYGGWRGLRRLRRSGGGLPGGGCGPEPDPGHPEPTPTAVAPFRLGSGQVITAPFTVEASLSR